MTKPKLIRITTVPISLDKLLSGQLHFMSSYYNVTAISSDSKALNKIGEKEKVKVFSIEMTRKITLLSDLKAVLKLYKFLKNEKPFIVHTHTPKAGTIGMIASKLAGVPVRLHTVAGLPLLETRGRKRILLNLVERLTYYCATKVYPNSYGLEKIITKNYFCNPKKLKVLANGSSNGIDITYFSSETITNDKKLKLRKSLKIQEDDFVFIFVGRLVRDKGINEMVQAFKLLSKEDTKVKLLLVGPMESDLDPLLPKTLKEMESNPNMIILGYQNDVRPYFAISDTLVFPSYREGFPNVVMQAGAMSLPSIVTDINGCNEIIEEGINGTIIPPKNVYALKQAMQRMLNDSIWLNSLKSNARSMIASRFEQKLVWDALLKEYETLLKEKGLSD
jgi:glycosyltransferase involved in cell wall biosynthesis